MHAEERDYIGQLVAVLSKFLPCFSLEDQPHFDATRLACIVALLDRYILLNI
jgi:hypothetical protein